MIFLKFIILNFLVIYTTFPGLHSSPDIAKLENDQKILLESLRKNKDLNYDLNQKFKFLDKKDNNKSLNSLSATIPVQDEDSSGTFDTNYSPPVIVLLPEESSSREKWEYAVTLKCLGKGSFDAFTNIHNTRMAKMATIAGTTVSEINAEIKETELELQNVKNELESLKEKKKNLKPPKKNNYVDKTRELHINHNIKLLNQEIHVMELKLESLKKRLKVAVLFGNNGENKEIANDNQESLNETEDQEGSTDDVDDEESGENDYDL